MRIVRDFGEQVRILGSVGVATLSGAVLGVAIRAIGLQGSLALWGFWEGGVFALIILTIPALFLASGTPGGVAQALAFALSAAYGFSKGVSLVGTVTPDGLEVGATVIFLGGVCASPAYLAASKAIVRRARRTQMIRGDKGASSSDE